MLVGAARLLGARRATSCRATVVFMFQPGEEGYDGAGHMIDEGVLDAAGQRAGRGLRAARDLGRAARRGVRAPGPARCMAAADRLHGHRPRPRRARLRAAPRRRPDPGRVRDGDRAADAGDAAVRRLRPGRHHRRQLPRRHHATTSSRTRPTFLATVRSFSRRAGPRCADLVPRAGQRHRRRARADRRGRVPDEYPVTVNDAAEAAFAGQVITRGLFGADRGETARPTR